MISRATTSCPAPASFSATSWPPVSVSRVAVSLTVITGEAERAGDWARCWAADSLMGRISLLAAVRDGKARFPAGAKAFEIVATRADRVRYN